MNGTEILEQNTKNSFHFVKDDILMLEQEHKALLQRVIYLERQISLLQQQEPRFVGNKRTKDLHKSDCLLAQSTSGEQRTIFHSKSTGHRQGYKDCICLA